MLIGSIVDLIQEGYGNDILELIVKIKFPDIDLNDSNELLQCFRMNQKHFIRCFYDFHQLIYYSLTTK